MWVDQPAGVGFSTGLGTHDEKGVANNMLVSLEGKVLKMGFGSLPRFLQKFFQAFPQYQNTKFYIFGESYAGLERV